MLCAWGLGGAALARGPGSSWGCLFAAAAGAPGAQVRAALYRGPRFYLSCLAQSAATGVTGSVYGSLFPRPSARFDKRSGGAGLEKLVCYTVVKFMKLTTPHQTQEPYNCA